MIIDIEEASMKANQLAVMAFALSDALEVSPLHEKSIHLYQSAFCDFLKEDLGFSLSQRILAIQAVLSKPSDVGETGSFDQDDEERIQSYAKTLAGLADALDHKSHKHDGLGGDQTPHVDFEAYRQSFEVCLRRPSLLSVRNKLDVLENIIKTHHSVLPHYRKSANMFVEVFDTVNSSTTPPPCPKDVIDQARQHLHYADLFMTSDRVRDKQRFEQDLDREQNRFSKPLFS